MSHDDDWSSVLSDNSDPSPSEFFRRIDDQFTITEKDGVTFLVPNSKLELPGRSRTPTALRGPPPQIPRKVARAMYDFSGSGDDSELAFRAGDMIAVVDEILDGWWMGELNGKQGLFPTSYTDIQSDTLRLPADFGSSGNGVEMASNDPRCNDDDEDVSDAATIVSNVLRDTDDGEENLDAATMLTSVADDDEERDLTVSYDYHTQSGSSTSSQMMKTTKHGRPFLQDTFDLYVTLIVSLQLIPHKLFFKTFQNSFSTDEAIRNLSSLKSSRSSRGPDPREPSRLVTTNTTVTFSMTRPMAKAMGQHFMDARLIEDPTGPSSNLFRDRGLYVLTPKGLHVLERFISKHGINSDHLQNVFATQPICSELLHLERRLSDDEIIVSQSVITMLFRRFVGHQPNYPNAPQDPFARHAERSRGVLLMDITDRAQPAQSPQLQKHCFAAVAALEWLCDFTSVVCKEEAAELAAQFVRFGLITLVGEDSATAGILTVRDPVSDGNSPVSPHGEFRCTAKAIYKITDEGRRVAHWDDARGVHDSPSTSSVNLNTTHMAPEVPGMSEKQGGAHLTISPLAGEREQHRQSGILSTVATVPTQLISSTALAHQRLLSKIHVPQTAVMADPSSPVDSEGIPSVSDETVVEDHIICSVLCMYDYKSTDTDRLEFLKNEILDVVEQTDSGWWAAMRRGGDFIGWIPRNFVKPLSKEMAEKLWNIRQELRGYEYDAAEQLYSAANKQPRSFDSEDEDDENGRERISNAAPTVRKYKFPFFEEALEKPTNTKSYPSEPSIQGEGAQVRGWSLLETEETDI
ncbi:hypothetical protein DFH06DRAFT_521946 [Mycena polygramma]|nr:hypothetical protein DFH06DRAFT_521946 [Mycena polygramma]